MSGEGKSEQEFFIEKLPWRDWLKKAIGNPGLQVEAIAAFADLIEERDEARADKQTAENYVVSLINERQVGAPAGGTLEAAIQALRDAERGLDMIHSALMSNGPKQASGEVTAHWLAHVRNAIKEIER